MTAQHYLAIVVSGVAYMILGALWYSPGLLGKVWMKGIGKSEEQVKADFKPSNYLWAFIGSLVVAYGLARVLFMMEHGTMLGASSIGISDGFMVGALAGFCFAFATFFVNDAMETRPCSLTLTNGLYHLIGFIVMGVILGAWR